MHWIRKTGPLEEKDNRKYMVKGMMKFHVKYCPVDNQGEVHVIRKSEFTKLFIQATNLKKEDETIGRQGTDQE